MKQIRIKPGPDPPKLDSQVISFNTGVLFDAHRIGYDFGACLIEPHSNYSIGETVRSSFISGNPRNNLLLEKTFLTVERQTGKDSWEVVLTDANWETRYVYIDFLKEEVAYSSGAI